MLCCASHKNTSFSLGTNPNSRALGVVSPHLGDGVLSAGNLSFWFSFFAYILSAPLLSHASCPSLPNKCQHGEGEKLNKKVGQYVCRSIEPAQLQLNMATVNHNRLC
mmetsp:Transcript_10114/g.23398  ORF Transcript_10114/g.23398 Transcript_10114/m.23398 type:complete len:107 (-) Transcript_10114:1176-1496(-)